MTAGPHSETAASGMAPLPVAVGVVGLGAMGAPIAHNISASGLSIVVLDSNPQSQSDFVFNHSNAVGASSLSDLAVCNVVVLVLPSSDIVDSVVLGESGLLAYLRPGSTVIDMGSSIPRRTRALAREAAIHSIDVVDAPVSGGVARARMADLAVMVGGDVSQFERLGPLLRTTGSTVIHVGAVGSGHAAKALNNLLSATGLVAAAEVLLVGRKFGIDPSVLLSVLNASSGRNQATETKYEKFILPRSFDAGFSAQLMKKDIRIARDLAKSEGIDLVVGTALGDLWDDAVSSLEPGADHTEVIRVLEEISGVFLTPNTDAALIE